MKQLLFLALAACSIAVGLARATGSSSVTAVHAQESADTPQAVFKAKCAFCHGENGKSTDMGKAMKAPDLTSKEVQSETDETLHKVIAGGKGNMPPFASTISSEMTDQLIKYVRTFKADAAAPGAPAVH